MAAGNTTRALRMLRDLPRVTLSNLSPLPQKASKRKELKKRGTCRGGNSGRSDTGQKKHGNLPRLGFEGGNTPFYLMIPKEPFYKGWHLRKSYSPLNMLSLQRMIDLGRIDKNSPIDIVSVTNTRLFTLNPVQDHGIWLTEDGADSFKSCINIEVQWASELTIAAIEKNGGRITTRYYDPMSLVALADIKKFFQSGKPIPRCHLPTQDCVEYYTNPKNRGYLADPDLVQEARIELAQKYGYTIPEVDEDTKNLMLESKDPRQVFFNLQPGWIVNLKEKVIYKTTDPEYEQFYQS
ncbi:39S ribosomal protein L15, mitochondrial [Octopus bimaculoides]|uniref:Large ribosomal subunit protein uL15m n=1 Tax=Octopus bimaculoides TaxID=37653 RepID=A0A0L8H1R5_OCTBM|nr:39S ribosomal protein L15, mitochondrial [Octopus bimaculoides]|eukprot:XP_014776138.1 PREDICTED: 39S ribosomal protein L15, mitochondrial-like [Octopus bimaculoides]